MNEHLSRILLSFKTDIEGFCYLAKSGQLKNIISTINSFDLFIKKRQKPKYKKAISSVIHDHVLDADKSGNKTRDLFNISHIAACCSLFDNWTIQYNDVISNTLNSVIEANILSSYNNSEESIKPIEDRIHISDTIRIKYILMCLGLEYPYSSSGINQISFAAGNAYRDVYGLHNKISYKVDYNDSNVISSITATSELSTPERIVLIDNNPLYKEHYDHITNKNKDWLLALNIDMDVAMKNLSEQIDNNTINKFNHIIGIRIDHEMYSNVSEFFNMLKDMITDNAIFVFTVGAGHTLDEYIGRVELFKELVSFLSNRKMKPLLIKLHKDGDYEKQRLSPLFGVSSFTSYEILYCKIIKNNL